MNKSNDAFLTLLRNTEQSLIELKSVRAILSLWLDSVSDNESNDETELICSLLLLVTPVIEKLGNSVKVVIND